MQITLVAREITWMYQRITVNTQNAMHNKQVLLGEYDEHTDFWHKEM